MKRLVRKYIGIALLSLLTCNIIIAPIMHAMAVPSVVVQQIPRLLYSAYACTAALVTSYWPTQQGTAAHPTSIKQRIMAIATPEPEARKDSANIPSISRVPQTSRTCKNPTKTLQATTSCTPYTTSEHIKFRAEQVAQQLAHEEKKQLILNLNIPYARSNTFPCSFEEKPAYICSYTEDGILCTTQDEKLYLSIQFVDNSEGIKREEIIQFKEDIGHLRHLIQDYPEVKDLVISQLQEIVTCFTELRSQNVIDYLNGCYALKDLCIVNPLARGLNEKVEDLKTLYFHIDWTPCLKTMHAETLACDYMMQFLKWTDKQVGDLIPRSSYISNQEYTALKTGCAPSLFNYFWRWCKTFVGHSCGFWAHHVYSPGRFRDNLAACIAACEKGDFEKAQQLHDEYNKKEPAHAFCAVISYYKEQQYKALYDENGILRAAHDDPLYKAHTQSIKTAAPKSKKDAFNETFLVRHNIKNMMHKKWHIPEDAPACVHSALYALMDNECSALADISLLQKRVEEIIAAAPAEQRDELIHAFYLENGILKEYNCHTQPMNTFNVPHAILGIDATQSRHQLNILASQLITNPEKTTNINTAIEYLGKSLSAKTEAEHTDYKNKFDSLYLKLTEQPQQQKPTVTPQGDDQPTPDGQKPGPDRDKETKELTVYKNTQKEVPAHIADAIKRIKKVIHSTGLTMSKTVERHFLEIVTKGPRKGQWSRPYMRDGMNLIIEEIMEACTPEKDLSLKNGLKWVIKGSCKGGEGIWELVIDLDKYEIVHFLFK